MGGLEGLALLRVNLQPSEDGAIERTHLAKCQLMIDICQI